MLNSVDELRKMLKASKTAEEKSGPPVAAEVIEDTVVVDKQVDKQIEKPKKIPRCQVGAVCSSGSCLYSGASCLPR